MSAYDDGDVAILKIFENLVSLLSSARSAEVVNLNGEILESF